MTKKILGKKCPKFTAESTGGKNISSEDFLGKNVVIYFYPKDSTPGCTTKDERLDSYKEFKSSKFVASAAITFEPVFSASKFIVQIFHSSFYQIQTKKFARHLMS